MISLATCPPAKPPGGFSICSTQSHVGQMRLVLWSVVCWFNCIFHCFCAWLFSRFCFSFVCRCLVLVLFFFSFSGLGGSCLQNSCRTVIIWTSFEILKGFFQVWTKQWKMVWTVGCNPPLIDLSVLNWNKHPNFCVSNCIWPHLCIKLCHAFTCVCVCVYVFVCVYVCVCVCVLNC